MGTPIRALVVALLLAACAGNGAVDTSMGSSEASRAADSDPGVAPPSADAGSGVDGGVGQEVCELLSDADLVELTTWGAGTVEPGPQQGVFDHGCLWTLTDGTSSALYGPATISLGVVAPDGRSYYDTFFAPYAEEYDQEPLVGVGDAGLIDAFTATILAVEGDAFISLQWLDLGSDGQIEMATALAERVFANLRDR